MICKNIKFFSTLILMIAVINPALFLLYRSLIESTLELIRGEDYFDFDPKQFPVLLILPIAVLTDIFLILLLFPFREKVRKILEKIAVPVGIYCGISLVLGFLVSLIVSIYPLSTHYYKCNSTSMISSGSYYARTKEMCKERARLRAEEREKKKTESGGH
jgi:hypothetical protein